MIAIADVRPRAAAALAPASDDDPQIVGLTDAVQPPCLQIAWAQPWLVPNGQAPAFFARLSLLAIGGRVDAGGALDDLEDLVQYAVARLAIDGLPWSLTEITAPRGTQIGGIDYLIARCTVQMPVDGTKARPAPVEAVA